MAAEDDIKRIIIVAEGDTLRQTEGPAPSPAGNAPTPQDIKEDFRAALDDIAQQMEAGLHPEPILPAPASASEADDYIQELIDAIRGTGGLPPQQPPSMLPFGNAPYPSFASPYSHPPISAPPSGSFTPPPVPPTPPTPPKPPTPSPVPSPRPGPPPVPPPVPPPSPTPPIPPPVPPGPPPVPPGALPLGGAAALLEVLGPIGIAAIAIDQGIQSLIEVAEQIDRHLLSLAEDIRPFSGNVQGADAYTELMRITSMLERAQAIGPDVATYQMQRAELDAKLTRFVTKIESEILPLVIVAMEVINNSTNDYTLTAIKGLITGLAPIPAMILHFLRGKADEIVDRYSKEDINMLEQLDRLIRGNSEMFFKDKKEMEEAHARHPLGEGVFF
jgi:hypothetical protein